MSRRRFLQLATVAGGALAAPWARSGPAVAEEEAEQSRLAARLIPQFVDPLPRLHTIVAGAAPIELVMREFRSAVLPTGYVLPDERPYAGTWTWGYREPGQPVDAPYIGPLVVATRGTPTTVAFVNELGSANMGEGDDTDVRAYADSTDQTLHWADPYGDMLSHLATPPTPGSEGAQNYAGPIPAVPHLHGGEVPPEIDGGPDSWFTSDGEHHGHAYHAGPSGSGGGGNVSVYRYPNSQEAAPLWFHDHTLGATRLNVYAGLAGGYLLVDQDLELPPSLPGPGDITPLVIQDRMFDVDGQLFFPAASAAGQLWTPNPEHPYWVPEFLGDTIVVNGKAWPYQEVAARRHRFIVLNGSNARTYELFLTDPVTHVDGPPMWVIGTDGGYLDRPVKIDPNSGPAQHLVVAPGERYDVIIDFNDPTWLARNRGSSGSLLLKNIAKAPFPNGTTPSATTTGRVMQFVIGSPGGPDTSYNPDPDAPDFGGPLRPGGREVVRLVDPSTGSLAAGVAQQLVRQLTLNEVMGEPEDVESPVTGELASFEGGPLEVLVNNTEWHGRRVMGVVAGKWDYVPIPGYSQIGTAAEYASERPGEGTTEVWEIVNLTEDAHPIHLHLVQFQVQNRQGFDVRRYRAAYERSFPGGGYDPVTGQGYPVATYIPAWGPPLPYSPDDPRSGGKYGGNPDVTPYLRKRVDPAGAHEAGWKDTVIAYPGQVTRLVVRWAPTDLPVDADPADLRYPFDPGSGGHGYVWHCHIVDHEDNEMMRPTLVDGDDGAPRTWVVGVDY